MYGGAPEESQGLLAHRIGAQSIVVVQERVDRGHGWREALAPGNRDESGAREECRRLISRIRTDIGHVVRGGDEVEEEGAAAPGFEQPGWSARVSARAVDASGMKVRMNVVSWVAMPKGNGRAGSRGRSRRR